MRCLIALMAKVKTAFSVVTSTDETATVGYEYIAHSIDNRVVLTNLTAQLEYAITNMAYIVSIHKTIEENRFLAGLHVVYIII